MRELVLTPRFERSFRHLVGKHPELRGQIETTLLQMAADLDDRRLKTHRLSGQLAGLYACCVRYDYRIVFGKQTHPKAKTEVLILVDIGTHDEVY